MKKIVNILGILAFTFVMVYSTSSWAYIIWELSSDGTVVKPVGTYEERTSSKKPPETYAVLPPGNYICVQMSGEQSHEDGNESDSQYAPAPTRKSR